MGVNKKGVNIMDNESVGKKIVEALKRQAENNINDEVATQAFAEPEISMGRLVEEKQEDDFFSDIDSAPKTDFFDDVNIEKEPLFKDNLSQNLAENSADAFEMPANITVLKKLIAQLPSGVSRHTGAQIIKQTMEALGISMKSVLQDAQQVQENLKISAKECQGSIQEYKKQIMALERQSQNYQKQYSALNDLISLFIQTTRV